MATHSSVLAWRIPGMEEPGGLLSVGSQSRTRLKRLSSSSSRELRPLLGDLVVKDPPHNMQGTLVGSLAWEDPTCREPVSTTREASAMRDPRPTAASTRQSQGKACAAMQAQHSRK